MKKGVKLLKENLITLTLRLPESIILDIDREIARRLYEAPGIILHRSDIARDLIVRSLRDRERSEVLPGHTALPHPPAPLERPQPPGSGPGEAPVPTGQDRGADRLPMSADQFDTKAAPGEDQDRTTVRTRRTRPAAAKG